MDRVRLGLVGVSGRGGMWHKMHNPSGDSVITAGCDADGELLEKFRDSLGGEPYITKDYRSLLARGDVDAVVIASPDFTHEEYALEAFRARKHVFCEKPMAITTEGCDRMLAGWKKSGLKLMVGHNMRYMRIYQTMKEIVDSGVIGEVKAVWVRHFVEIGSRAYFHDWHARRDRSTGLLLQKASHDLDMIHWITGSFTKRVAAFGGLDYFGGDKPDGLLCSECPDSGTCPEAMPDAVARRQFCAFRKEINVEDNNVVIMELENGIKASYLQCHFTPDYFRNYTFIGTEGRLESLDENTRVALKTRNVPGNWKSIADRVYEVKPASGSHGGADPVVTRDFIDMILHSSSPLSTPEASRMSVAAGCAATESLRAGGRVVEVPPLPGLNRSGRQ